MIEIKQTVPFSEREALEAEVAISKTEKNYSLIKFIEYALQNNEMETIEEMIKMDDNYSSAKQLYGVYLEEGNFSQAQEQLNSLEINSTDKQNFISIQEINLEYRMNQDAFELSEEQQKILLTIAKENSTLSGYAISLLHQLTDYNIEVDLPEFPEASAKRANQFSIPEISQEQLLVYPNPAQNNVMVSINQEGFTNLNLTDLNGKLLKSININNETSKIQLDVSNYKNGMYFISLINNDGKKISTKLVLLK